MSNECGLATARKEYALEEHEAELLELPHESTDQLTFQKQQVHTSHANRCHILG